MKLTNRQKKALTERFQRITKLSQWIAKGRR
jgi:hypothetical protein